MTSLMATKTQVLIRREHLFCGAGVKTQSQSLSTLCYNILWRQESVFFYFISYFYLYFYFIFLSFQFFHLKEKHVIVQYFVLLAYIIANLLCFVRYVFTETKIK